MSDLLPSLKDVREALTALFEPGQVIEVRALGGLRYTSGGYYNDHDALASAIVLASKKSTYGGVYWTLQKIEPSLLARRENRWVERVSETTADHNVIAYRWLLIDLDPVRATGISASDAEKAAAHELMETVVKYVRDLGHAPLIGDSGNGYHVYVKVDLATEDAPLVQRVLASLAARFDTNNVKVDQRVWNPARIAKVFGSIARKGDSTADRPHRAAKMLVSKGTAEPLARDILEKIAAEAPAPANKAKKSKKSKDVPPSPEKLEEFLAEAKIGHGPRIEWKTGFKWELDCCPFDPSHLATSVVCTCTDTYGFSCMHNSCSGNHWDEFRAKLQEKIGHKFNFGGAERPSNGRPYICADPGQVNEMIAQSEAILHGVGLKYFERNRELVRTVHAREVMKKNDPYRRDESSILIAIASAETVNRDLDQRANYFITKGWGPKSIHVPESVVKQIVDRVYSEPRAVPYPTLDLVTSSPVLLPSGRVIGSEEFFSEGILFVPQKRNLYKPVPDQPSKAEAFEEMQVFADVFGKFPFIDPDGDAKGLKTASYSVVLSAILTLVARPYLHFGPTPLHGFTAHMQRSGKSKLAAAASAAALGHKPTLIHYRDEEEFGKHLLPLMRASDRIISIDNIEKTLESSKLCSLLTECQLRDRILGESRELALRNTSVFTVTGNNLMIGGDLAVRSLRCDIDAGVERPEERKFEFDPVTRALEMHPELNRAALLALRAYIVTKPPWVLDREPYGGFEDWDRLVSGCLTWLGFTDPYKSRTRVIGDDPQRETNLALLEALKEEFPGQEPFTVAIIDKKGLGSSAHKLLLKNGVFETRQVGWRLKRLAGRIAGGLQLKKASDPNDKAGNVGQWWKVVRVAETLGPSASATPSQLELRGDLDTPF